VRFLKGDFSMTDVELIESLGGQVVPTNLHQSWMRFRAEVPGLGIGSGWGGDFHEAARDFVRRLPLFIREPCPLIPDGSGDS
jgi:hypothetical protein